MGSGHHHDLYVERPSVVHRLPPHAKIAATVVFVVAVVATPRGVWWPYAVYAAALAAVALTARLPVLIVVRRMLVEVPFVVFALAMPIFATGPRVDVLGMSLSESGLVSAGTLLAKGTLGVVASILLAATTHARDLVRGLQTLRLPSLVVQILSFMVRYAEVVADDMRRMRIARESRCFEARHLGHLRVVARSAGALFVRSYERGERVHLAMLARGYTGQLPSVAAARAGALAWGQAALLPAVAIVAMAVAWMSG